MIKIIKQGTLQTTTCPNCGCQFSYEEEDIVTKLLHGTLSKNTHYMQYTVECPQCHSDVVLTASRGACCTYEI